MQVRDQFRDSAHFSAAEARMIRGMATSRKMEAAGRVPAERVEVLAAKRVQYQIDLLRVRHAGGASFEELAPEARWILDQCGGRSLFLGHALWLSCFALLLGVSDREELHPLFWDYQKGISTGQRDSIFDWVLGHDARLSPPQDYWDFEHERPRSGWRVIEAAEAGEAAEEALRQLVVHDWMKEALDDSQLDRTKDTYMGFFCMEGAVIATRLGIDDALVRGHSEWPQDLVDAARSGVVFPETSDRDYEEPMFGSAGA